MAVLCLRQLKCLLSHVLKYVVIFRSVGTAEGGLLCEDIDHVTARQTVALAAVVPCAGRARMCLECVVSRHSSRHLLPARGLSL
jgi:hypothetical protein